MAGLIPFNRDNSLFGSRYGFSNMLDDLFNDMLPTKFFNTDTFNIDVSETEKEYLVEAELPGVNKEEIKLELEDNNLIISVEKKEDSENKKGNYIHKETRYGSMQRSIYLADATLNNADAEYKDGILKITLEKQDQDDTSKKIEIR